ncbi:MAG: hypothetical protein ACXAE3_11375 [Candidatus Kariarchaeaceae archaeon]|jgi:hypothetical protein
MDILTSITVFAIPSLALVAPFLIVGLHITKNDLKLILSQRQIIKYSILTVTLTILIFILLSYLTGDLIMLFYGQPGFFSFDGGFGYIFANNLSFTFRLDPGLSLFVVSFLSSLMYAALLVLPPVCTYIPSTPDVDGSRNVGSFTGSMTAAVSAVASTAVCCSTSVAAVLAPTVLTLLGPFAPFLIYLSLGILVYSFRSVVLPRFPTVA